MNNATRFTTLVATALLFAAGPALAAKCDGYNKPDKPLRLYLRHSEMVLKDKKQMCFDFTSSNAGTFRIAVDVGDSGYDWSDGPIRVQAKSSGGGQPVIEGSNSSDDPYTVVVTVQEQSGATNQSSDYGYLIEVPTVGTLDPIVRIIREVSFILRWQDLSNALGEIGMDLAELEAVLRWRDDQGAHSD